MAKLSAKYEIFCRAYVIDPNATNAAVKAGYSVKTARQQGSRLLSDVNILDRIKELTEKMENKELATAEEVLLFLTHTMRGTLTTSKYTMMGERYEAEPNMAERLKAGELLGKRHVLFTDKIEHSGYINPYKDMTDEQLDAELKNGQSGED